MKDLNLKFDFNDILITPDTLSPINSRSEVNPKIDGFFPLMTAPMDTVISLSNSKWFSENGIIPVLPRYLEKTFHFVQEEDLTDSWLSYDLNEFKEFVNTDKELKHSHILIDIANGHMKSLLELAKRFKEKYPDKFLMIGNIANPSTFTKFANVGVDYIRIGIGNGAGCLTTEQTGIGFPMASLIQECYKCKKSFGYNVKIVADGGMKKYSDIIKALALGADYVMCGSIFNKALQSHSPVFVNNGGIISNKEISPLSPEAMQLFNSGVTLMKMFRGMSTKEVQMKWNNKVPKTSEGITEYRKVEYTIEGWVENFEHYLRSAMSYTGSSTLEEFKESNIIHITQNAYQRFNK